ncbi:type II toxin-antitoxin system VapC family toxin [Candidatus Poriferisodalis sp.]|uniref:type II toxin-antitoxin system VapC family toxin n=1 Tax=Candidatus Poriferisodalis sp. TaxID=3101277 RepID=UPI003B02010B
MATFVDTSVWYAAVNKSDADRDIARSILSEHESSLVTSDHVLVELWNLANVRIHHLAANQAVSAIHASRTRIECTTDHDLQAAESIRLKFEDQGFSLTDRTSWALMERLGISEALSLDVDFRVYRYGPERRRAFRVLP